jgi:hypothetical protein
MNDSVDIVTAFARLLPQHVATLHLKHNQHKNYYESAEEYLRDRNLTDNDFAAQGERERCIAQDSIWELQWYPSTPVGFNLIIAASLEALITAAVELA